jgi:hypothetical protein
MGYKILGFVVWNGAKWYMRGRPGTFGARKALAAGVVGAGVAVLVMRGSRAAQRS